MGTKNELKNMISPNEAILYEGRPDFKCFIFESVFNPMLPFAIIWALFDSMFIGAMFGTGDIREMNGLAIFILLFFLVHLMPVWMYLGGVLTSVFRFFHTYYIVTNEAVYTASGVFRKNYQAKLFSEKARVELHRGLFDQLFGVGDLRIVSSNMVGKDGEVQLHNDMPSVPEISIDSISMYNEVYTMIRQYQEENQK